MPIPDSALYRLLLPRVVTLHTPLEEVLALFAEQAHPEHYYAVVRVGLAGYAVLSEADLLELMSEHGTEVAARTLGSLPHLRLQQSARAPVYQHIADEQQARAMLASLPPVGLYPCLVVLDAADAVAGLFMAPGFESSPALPYGEVGTVDLEPKTLPGQTQQPSVLGPSGFEMSEEATVLQPKGVLSGQGQEAGQPPVQPHVNTRFEQIGPNEPLTAGRFVPLVISVGAPTASNLAQSSRPFAFTFPDDSSPVTFNVAVDADPDAWAVSPVRPTLVVAPPGTTQQEALFIVQAQQPGRDKLHISLERADTGATVQHIWLPVVAVAEGEQAALPPASERLVTSLPLGTTQTQRRRVELTITSAVEGFKAMVRADLPRGQVRETYHVPVNAAAIQNATLRLRQELEAVVHHQVDEPGQPPFPFANRETLTVDEGLARKVLVRLADVGQQFWSLLFQSARAPEGLKQLAEELRDLPQGSTIQVIIESQQFIVPWALLYDKPGRVTEKTLDWAGFWGYRYLLDMLPPGRYPAPDISQMPLRLQLLFNDDEHLRTYTDQQEQFIRAQLDSAHIGAAWGIDDVEHVFSHPSDAALVYLYCHGKQTSGALSIGALASESAIFFGDLSAASGTRLADLRRLPAAPFQKQPLVFLNACESGAQDAFFYDGFMPFFVEEMGARGFIGTEVAAPQLLAHDVALNFLEAFARGQPVGEILWHLRRHYLDQHHNILAFNYSLYCLSEVRLVNPA